MASVLSIVPTVSAGKKEDLLALVDALRARVAAGDVVEIAYCTVDAQGAVTTCVGPSEDIFRMLGAMERMKLRFHAKHLEE